VRSILLFAGAAVAATLVACGGGGGGGASGGITPVEPTPTPMPTATLPASITHTVTLGSPQTISFGQIASGASGSVSFPAAVSGSASTTITLQSSLPNGAPVPQSKNVRRPESLGATVTPLVYIVVTPTSALTFGANPGFTFTFPVGTLQGYAYVAFYDPTHASLGWNTIAGPIQTSGTSVTFPSEALTPPLTLAAANASIFAIVENGTPLPTPTPASTPTPTPSPTPPASPSPASSASPIPGSDGPPLNGALTGPGGTWGPTAVANALQFPVQSGYYGNGLTIAVIMDAYPSSSDIATYFSYFGIPRSTTFTPENVGAGPTNASQSSSVGEATLDVEMIASLAPGANIIVYGMPDLSLQSLNNAYSQIESDAKANITSYSAGGCENAYDQSTIAPIVQTGANAGIAFIASAGDQGNECPTGGTPQNQPGVLYPASDPNVIGIGGTESNPPQFSLTSTQAWNDAACPNGPCATGGGVSTQFALPAYQAGLAGIASSSFRNVPDIAMPAEDVAEYLNGHWYQTYGTSWSAPQFAAMLAETYEYCKTTFKAAPSLPYYVDQTNPSALIDVVSGNNQFGGTSPFYNAARGYDNVSGVGVPLGMPFANTLCPSRVPAFVGRQPIGVSYTASASAGPRTVDVTPRVPGLSDLGIRPASQGTTVQFVLHPNRGNEEALIQVLQAHGFTITQTFSNQLVVDAQAPASAVSSFFSTSIHNVTQGRYGVRYMPTTQALIPASIAPYVSGVVLDNVVTMKAL